MTIGVIMPRWLWIVLLVVGAYVAWTKLGLAAKLKG